MKEAVESRTSFTDVYVGSDEPQFVYAMITDTTGMKFELPLGFKQDKDEDDVSYLVWEDNKPVTQSYVTNDIDSIVSKAQEMYAELS